MKPNKAPRSLSGRAVRRAEARVPRTWNIPCECGVTVSVTARFDGSTKTKVFHPDPQCLRLGADTSRDYLKWLLKREDSIFTAALERYDTAVELLEDAKKALAEGAVVDSALEAEVERTAKEVDDLDNNDIERALAKDRLIKAL